MVTFYGTLNGGISWSCAAEQTTGLQSVSLFFIYFLKEKKSAWSDFFYVPCVSLCTHSCSGQPMRKRSFIPWILHKSQSRRSLRTLSQQITSLNMYPTSYSETPVPRGCNYFIIMSHNRPCRCTERPKNRLLWICKGRKEIWWLSCLLRRKKALGVSRKVQIWVEKP